MMQQPLLPLKLDVLRPIPEGGKPPSQEEMRAIMDRVFKRDHNMCRYCGMYSPTGATLEIDNQDGDHCNWDISNLVSSCLWCHGCHHLEFSLAAGATLVQWDYPQDAISRLTQQVTISGSLYENYNSLIQEGARRREHNFPGGELSIIVNELPAMRKRGEHDKVESILEMMHAENIRLTYPTHLYLTALQSIPGVTREAWKHFRRYYLTYVNETISDSDIRGKLLKAWRVLSKVDEDPSS